MTRINCVPATELSGKHLVAEYRELPRIVRLVNRAWARGDQSRALPCEYTLGAGHVLFFYRRLGWISRRYAELVAEMRRRGYSVTYPELPALEVGRAWMDDWTPDETALSLNRARIEDRLRGSRP